MIRKPGIARPLFLELTQEFLKDSGYEILYKGKKVEYPIDSVLFFRRLFTFILAMTAASKRAAFSPLIEFEFVDSKRKEGKSILRIKPYKALVRLFRKRPELVYSGSDFSLDALLERSYTNYNAIIEAYDLSRDTIVTTQTFTPPNQPPTNQTITNQPTTTTTNQTTQGELYATS